MFFLPRGLFTCCSSLRRFVPFFLFPYRRLHGCHRTWKTRHSTTLLACMGFDSLRSTAHPILSFFTCHTKFSRDPFSFLSSGHKNAALYCRVLRLGPFVVHFRMQDRASPVIHSAPRCSGYTCSLSFLFSFWFALVLSFRRDDLFGLCIKFSELGLALYIALRLH